jgi:hypothetical protein
MFLWADLVSIVRQPVAALRTIDRDRGLSAGIAALVLSVSVPAAVSELAALGPYRPAANLGSLGSLSALGVDIYTRWVYQHRFVLPVYGLVVSLALWFVAAGLIHVVARALDGKGAFLGYLKLAGYTALTGLVALPITLADAGLKIADNARVEPSVGQLAGLLGIAIFLWQNGLLVLAAREHYGVSLERAAAAVLGPIGCLIALAIAAVIVITVLTVVLRQAAL